METGEVYFISAGTRHSLLYKLNNIGIFEGVFLTALIALALEIY